MRVDGNTNWTQWEKKRKAGWIQRRQQRREESYDKESLCDIFKGLVKTLFPISLCCLWQKQGEAERNRAGVCYTQLPGTDQRTVIIRTKVLKIRPKWSQQILQIVDRKNRFLFKLQLSTCPHVHAYAVEDIQLSHQIDTCACPAWSLGHSLLAMFLVVSGTPWFSLSTTSHFPQCVYSFGLLPGSFYHLRILLPALISLYDICDHFHQVPALPSQLHGHLQTSVSIL